jgi:hypothetical protein
MAQMSEQDNFINIDLEDAEESYIYYSICDYSEAILSQMKGINDKIKNICKICKRTEDDTDEKQSTQLIDSSQPEDDGDLAENLKRPSTVSVNTETKRLRVDPSQGSVVESSQTSIELSKIKRIPSDAFQTLLGKSPTKIKDVNRELILNLQSISEDSNRKITHHPLPQRTFSSQSLEREQSGRQQLPYINYGGRLLVVLPIPDDRDSSQIIFNKNGTWCPNGGIGPSYPTSKKCPFYKSTGKSNDTNFPGMWFPFFRIKTSVPSEESTSNLPRGWIYKAWGLQSVRQLRQRLHQRFSDEIPAVPEQNETGDFLYCFLEKFSHWWQIQLSLQLPTPDQTQWDTDPLLINFKNIVLTYDYDHFQSPYFKRTEIKHVKYTLNEVAPQTYNEASIKTGIGYIPETINLWLRGGPLNSDMRTVLCIEDSDDQ